MRTVGPDEIVLTAPCACLRRLWINRPGHKEYAVLSGPQMRRLAAMLTKAADKIERKNK
jgi:hypothetical protein